MKIYFGNGFNFIVGTNIILNPYTYTSFIKLNNKYIRVYVGI